MGLKSPPEVMIGRSITDSRAPQLKFIFTGHQDWKRDALRRRKIMRKARSNKQRPILLAELERRYRESPNF